MSWFARDSSSLHTFCGVNTSPRFNSQRCPWMMCSPHHPLQVEFGTEVTCSESFIHSTSLRTISCLRSTYLPLLIGLTKCTCFCLLVLFLHVVPFNFLKRSVISKPCLDSLTLTNYLRQHQKPSQLSGMESRPTATTIST